MYIYKAKTAKNHQSLDILAYNLANKPSFKHLTKGLFENNVTTLYSSMERWAKRLFVRF